MKKTNKRHYAILYKSERLNRVYELLKSGESYTSRQIVKLANVIALSATIDELRKNGVCIQCTYVRTTRSGARVYEYKLLKGE